ncbi:MAG TPA: hypothetical protein VM942_05345 [Acidimicrobiales bacterium]|nr:hypothetical protein [Acidimicrobiales bacterium]
MAMALATACGGSGGPTAAADPVAPATYVASVCRAMVSWYVGVGRAFQASDVRPDSDRPEAIRADLLVFFDGVGEATESMLTEVGEAGRPDVPDGAGVAGELRDSLAAVATRLEDNRDEWAAIPLSDVQPAASIEGAMTVVAEQFEAVHVSVDRMGQRSPDLGQAQDREPACEEFETQR